MSQAQIGNLNVRLGLDTAQFSNGLKQAQSSLAGLSGSLKTLAVGAAAGAAAALTALGFALGNSLKRMDDLGKAAQKVGIPVDEFSKLEYAARLSDVSLESLTTTLARFSRSLSEISAGGDNDAGAALRALGISATDAEGKLRPTSAIIEDVAAKFETMRDGANKTALAIALFGRSGADMIPLLNGGREAIRGAGEELERFGGVVTPEAARQAEQFNDNLTRLQTAFDSLMREAIGPILPHLVALTERFIELVKSGGGVAQWIEWSMPFWEELGNRIATTRKEIQMITQALRDLGLIDPAPLEIDIFGRDLPTAPGAPSSPKTDAPALPAIAATKKELVPPGTIDDIYGAGEAVSALEESFTSATAQAGTFSDSLMRIGETISQGISDGLYGLITGTMTVKEAFASMAQSIIQSLADIAAELAASAALRMILGSLGGGGGAGLNIGGMVFGGLFANGGYLGSGKWGIAGEAGPEIIHGPARITPMDKAGGAANVTVNVTNNTPAQVSTSRRADGSIDIMIEEIANQLARGGGKVDAALQRGYGLRRAGR
jgi:hypothetical protein